MATGEAEKFVGEVGAFGGCPRPLAEADWMWCQNEGPCALNGESFVAAPDRVIVGTIDPASMNLTPGTRWKWVHIGRDGRFVGIETGEA